MILTEKEFVVKCKKIEISRLQLAYLIVSGAIHHPLSFEKGNGVVTHLFDDIHFDELKELLHNKSHLKPIDIIEERDYEKYSTVILKQKPGLSAKCSKLIEFEIRDFEQRNKEKILKKKMEADVREFLDGLASAPKRKKFIKIRRFLSKFRIFPMKIDYDEQIGMAIRLAGLSIKFIEFYFPRIRPFDLNNPKDKCLHDFVKSKWGRSWELLYPEISLIKKFQEHEKSLFDWELEKALSFISDIETEYKKVAEIVVEYMNQLDPDLLLSRLITFQEMFPVIESAQNRAKEKSLESLSEFEKELGSSFKKFVGALMKSFL
jgi:hypothetical protein